MQPWLEQTLDLLKADFLDLPSVASVVQLTVRLVVAALLGGLLGYEREHAGKAAGIRTHMLVALGAAVFVLVPHRAEMGEDALSRVLQGLIAGIGFLGGGAILKMGDQGEIRGLTTAAGIWLTAAIGVSAGMGRIVSAILSTFLALVVLAVVPRLARRPRQPAPTKELPDGSVADRHSASRS